MNFFNRFFYQLFLALLLTFIIQSFFFQPFRIPSSSMRPGLQISDYLIVSKLSYGYNNSSFSFMFNQIHFFDCSIFSFFPKRGDVIVFILPKNRKLHYIKRVVGLPEETLQIKNGNIYINKIPLIRKIKSLNYNGNYRKNIYQEFLPNGKSYLVYNYIQQKDRDIFFDYNDSPIYKIPNNHFFLLGDNRNNSIDSRFVDQIGYISRHHVLGKAQFVFFTFDFSFFNFFENFFYSRVFRFID